MSGRLLTRSIGIRLMLASLIVTWVAPWSAMAQSSTQLWSELRLDWIKSHHLTLGLEIEPKVLVSAPPGDPGWNTIDIRPSIEITRGQWIDAVGELLVGRTRQTDDVNTVEITPRVGLRLHLLSNLRNQLAKERQPRRRLVLRTYLRLEWRNLFYSDDTPTSSSWRIRDRVETLYPINRGRITDDGAAYLLGDAEWFWPQGNPDERFANKQRVRAGLGYRHSSRWRFEVLYIWDRSRNSAHEGFTTSANVVDFRVRHVW